MNQLIIVWEKLDHDMMNDISDKCFNVFLNNIRGKIRNELYFIVHNQVVNQVEVKLGGSWN